MVALQADRAPQYRLSGYAHPQACSRGQARRHASLCLCTVPVCPLGRTEPCWGQPAAPAQAKLKTGRGLVKQQVACLTDVAI